MNQFIFVAVADPKTNPIATGHTKQADLKVKNQFYNPNRCWGILNDNPGICFFKNLNYKLTSLNRQKFFNQQ